VSENPQNPNAFELSSFDPDDASLTVHRMAAHDRLAYQSRVVLRLGQMLLAAGAGSYRVKASKRTCASKWTPNILKCMKKWDLIIN